MINKRKVGRPRIDQTPSIRATISIPGETYQVVEALAEQKKVSFAWVVRDALDKYVAEQWPLFAPKE
jgi:predicted transcriptional regulator